MANNLETEKKVMAVSMLAEGNSIRNIERMTGIHRDTIMRLGIRIGEFSGAGFFYGYGVTQRQATTQARARYSAKIKHKKMEAA